MLLGLHTAEVSVLFVGSRRMRSLNGRYRGIDRATDVLSFPMGGVAATASVMLGDIVVCVPRAAEQASAYGAPLAEEIRRLLVHGLLHLLGYDHEAGDYERRKMTAKERELLHALQTVA